LRQPFIRSTFFIILGILAASLFATLIGNIFIFENRSLWDNYIDFIFFVTLPVFLLGAIMFIAESGMFNVAVYSTNKVRSVISSKYRYTLQESESLTESQIEEHLKEKYLYADRMFPWTYPIFIGSSLVFVGIIIAVIIFYGI